MKLTFVYKILPALVHYTDNIKNGFGGIVNGPYVRIRPKYEGVDEGLFQHELTHVKQWYRTLGTHGIWYMCSETYRLNCEIEAYKVQASYYNYDAFPWMAKMIASKYNITKYSENQILDMLRH
jgi:hypothetical protein